MSNRAGMNSIKGGHFVSISVVYKQHPAHCLETECQTGALSIVRTALSVHRTASIYID